mgnify:FL=1
MTGKSDLQLWMGDRDRIDACLDEIIRLRAENAWLRSQVDLVTALAHREAVDELLTMLGVDDDDQ